MVTGVTPLLPWARQKARIGNNYAREAISELLGSLLFCLIATGGTHNLNAFIGRFIGNFSYEPIFATITTAFGYFLATLLFGGVSGAHVNPAISVGMSIAGRLSWVMLPLYIFLQLFGGYIGSVLAHAMFIETFGGNPKALSGSEALFLTNPGGIPIGSGFLNEIILSLIFMMAFLATKDTLNSQAPRYAQALMLPLVVIGLGLSFAYTTGVAINPIRDICPRLAALTYGWSAEYVMKGDKGEHWWIVGFIGPFIGAALGSVLYIFTIGAQLNSAEGREEEYKNLEEQQVDLPVPPPGSIPPHHHQSADNWRATMFVPKAAVGGNNQNHQYPGNNHWNNGPDMIPKVSRQSSLHQYPNPMSPGSINDSVPTNFAYSRNHRQI